MENDEENVNSILISIKKLLGLSKDYNAFDADIIMHINSVLMICNQLGVGVYDFQITGEDEEWSDFINNEKKISAVKSYVYLKVKMMFDPPTHASVIESITASIRELEWRLNNEAETQIEEVTESE